MKHAILILAHKNYSFLCKLVSYFEKDCEVFIHVDKKSSFTKNEISVLRGFPQVKVVTQKYAVHWAGFSILKCELYLLRKALMLSDANYFHLISGQDYPVRPLSYFLSFFEKNAGKNYTFYHYLPTPLWEGNTYRRMQYYYPYDWINGRTPRGMKRIDWLLKWQKRLHIKRRIPDYFEHLCGGSAWFSITRKATTVLLHYTRKHPAFYHRMNYTFVAEETYVPTVLVNLLPASEIVCDDLRFVRWVEENGSFPANLSKEHLNLLLVTHRELMFARKLDTPYMEHLLEILDQYVLKESEIRFLPTGGWDVNTFNVYSFDVSLADAILRWYRLSEMTSALDMGCGAGYYVAYWRSRGMASVGIDGNPHTQELSSLLLSQYPCEVGDITEYMEMEQGEQPFDLVTCLDVLPYIPSMYADIVWTNLTRLCARCLIFSLKEMDKIEKIQVGSHSFSCVENLLRYYGFVKNVALTNYLRQSTGNIALKTSLYAFEKIG